MKNILPFFVILLTLTLWIHTEAQAQAPTVTITPPTGPHKDAFDVTITFSEAVNGFVEADVTVAPTTLASVTLTENDGDDEYIATITPTPGQQGQLTINVAAGAAQSVGTSTANAAGSATVDVDAQAPTVTFSSDSGDKTEAFDLTITFSEAVYGFDDDDITFDPAGASVKTFTGSDGVYTANIQPKASGDLEIKVAAEVATDAAGNNNTEGTTDETIDLPMAIMVMEPEGKTGPYNEAFDVIFMFTETVDEFVVSDIRLTSGLVTLTGITGSAPTFTATLMPDNNTQDLLTIRITAGAVTNTDDIDYPESNHLRVGIDTKRPTVDTIEVPEEPQSGAFDVTITFSEDVDGFEADDIEFNGTPSATATVKRGTDGDAEYEVTITPTGSGTLQIHVKGDAVTDAAGNKSALSNAEMVTIDQVVPTVTITGVPTTEQKAAFDLTITFSKDVTGFAVPADLTITGEATAALKSGTQGPAVYTVTITPNANKEGDVTVKVDANAVEDSAGNGNTASATTSDIHIDTIVPTVAIHGLPPGEQKDPFTLVVLFSENVTGFAVGDLTVTGEASVAVTGRDRTYTVFITPNANKEDDVTVKVDADAAEDSAGNGNTASATTSDIHIDTIVPTVAITGLPTGAQKAAFDLTVTFSEDVTGFAVPADLTLTGPATATLAPGSSDGDTVYTVTITPDATDEGDVTVTVNANTVQDFALNNNTASPVSNTVHVDTIVPTVAISGEPTIEKNVPFDLTITFSEDVTGFAVPPDLTITGEATAALKSGAQGPAVYTVTITPNANKEGDVTVKVDANAATDTAGNGNTASPVTSNIPVDTIVPTVTITDLPTGAQKAAFDLTVTFSEDVTGFAVPADLTVTGPASASLKSGSGANYVVTITPTANMEGNVTVKVDANAATDTAGNGNTASPATSNIPVDSSLPTVAITGVPTGAQKAAFDLTVTFSESVTGFAVPADLTLTGPATASLKSGTGANYVVTITPTANMAGNVTVKVNANAATDTAGNGNTASPVTSNIPVDSSLPTVAITGLPTGAQKAAFDLTITFSESVTGFAVPDDLRLRGPATASLKSGTGANYVVTITPTANMAGNVTVKVKANAATDTAGNGNTASPVTSNIPVDTIVPTVAITGLPTGAQKAAFDLTVTFSESVTGFAVPADLTLTGPATASLKSGSGANYVVTITPNATSEGNVTVKVNANAATDTAGNGNTASPVTSNIPVDTIVPTVAITGLPTGAQKAAFDLTVTFSESVTGFAVPADLTLTGPATASLKSGSGANYVVTITPNATSEGNVTVKVNANAATDTAGNGNTASATTPNIHIDTIVPTVTITGVPTIEKNVAFDITITFSEDVDGFTLADDLTFTGPATVALKSGTQGPAIYTATITPDTNMEGDVTFSVDADAVADAAKNKNTASSSHTVHVDTIVPTVAITGVPGTEQKDAFDLTITFSEDVTGFAVPADLTITGEATAALKSGTQGPAVYTVTITPNTNKEGDVTVKVNANTVDDTASNKNTASAATSNIHIDTIVPTVAITGVPTTEQKDAFDLTITFSEDVTGFAVPADLTLTGEATAALKSGTQGPAVYTVTITPNANKEGDVTVKVNANAVDDTASNKNTASAATSNIHIDTIVPTVAITGVPGTEQKDAFDLTITFSEDVAGFTLADDLTFTGPATVALKSGTQGPAIYTATITPDATDEGDVTFSVDADAVEDAAKNKNTASSSHTVHVDTIVPTVAISGEPTIEKNVPFDLTITFSEEVKGFAVPADLTLTGPATATLASGSDGAAVYTVTITPNATSEDDVTVTVNADTVQDFALNDNTVSPVSQTVHVDTIVPTVEISELPDIEKNVRFSFTVTFSEPVNGFRVPEDLTITGSDLGQFDLRVGMDGESVYRVRIIPNTDIEGDITVQVNANSVQDLALNDNTASSVTPPIHVDTIVPTVAISGEPTIEKNVPFDLTVTFSEEVIEFQVPLDLTITGPADATLASGDEGDSVYTITITPDADSEGDVTVKVNVITVRDFALNGNTASPASNSVHVDTIVPTAAISGEPTIEKNVPFDLTVTFSEEVTGFQVPEDLVLRGPATATLASGSDGDAVYTITITPNTASEDDVTVRVAHVVVQDLALNDNRPRSPFSSPVHVDTIIPTVAISGEPTIEKNVPFDLTITFSEPVNGFAVPDDLTLTGPATASLASGSDGDTVYTVTITPNATSEGDVTVIVDADTVQDFALNDNTASPVSATVHVDTIVPTVAISGEPTIEKNVAFDLTITFSEPVNEFAVPADLTITNGNAVTASLASGSDGDSVYTVTITPNVDVEGSDVTVTVNAAAVQDFALNDNTASPASNSVHVDTRLPTVEITDVPVLEKRNDVFDITVTFSEEVNGFQIPDDMIIDGPTTATLTSGADGDSVYTVTITPNPNSRGDVTFQIPENTVRDFALNFNRSSTETNAVRIDTVPPVAEIQGLPTTTQNAPFDITIAFNEQVMGFATEDITVVGPATALLKSGVDGDAEYTVTITPNSNTSGSVTIQIPAGVVKDFANNDNIASEISDPVLISTGALIVEITGVPEDVQLGAFSVMIKFSGDVVGFELADVDISGDAVVQTSSLMGRGSSYMLDITPHPDTDGDVIIQVPADVAVDAAQNNNAASAPQTVSVAPSWMPDADLRAAVRDLLNLAEGEDFDQDRLTELTTLQSESSDITDLTGLELATDLTTLDLSDNVITDITSLTELTELTTLDLGGNTIGDITSLTGLTELTTLDLGGNTIGDITSLTGLTKLTTLDLGGNTIGDITSLAGLTELTTLDLSGNSISSITPLVGLTGLTTLDLSGNFITDITPLAGLTQIETLNLSDNSISNWGTLAGLTTLTTLDLSGNAITDLNIISNLTGLLALNLSDNSITDLLHRLRI